MTDDRTNQRPRLRAATPVKDGSLAEVNRALAACAAAWEKRLGAGEEIIVTALQIDPRIGDRPAMLIVVAEGRLPGKKRR